MSTRSGDSPPPPSWHPDPGNPQLLRYWDGSQWTEHTATNALAPRVSSERTKSTWQVIGGLGAGIGIFVTLLILASGMGVVGMLAGAGSSDSTTTGEWEAVTAESSEAAAKADLLALGPDLLWYYDVHPGAPPTITVGGDYYYITGEGGWHRRVPRSLGVGIGGVEGTSTSDWCVWVRTPQGDTWRGRSRPRATSAPAVARWSARHARNPASLGPSGGRRN